MRNDPKSNSAMVLFMIFSFFVVAGLVCFSGFISAKAAQRLCENSDYSVAQISPCTGPTGTLIHLTLRRKLKSPPATLLFKRVLLNGVPAQVSVPVSGLSVSAPPQLCTTGGGRWEVRLIDAGGKSQGVIGAFWPDCSSTSDSSGGASGSLPGNATPGAQRLCENSDYSVAQISPCTGPTGTVIHLTLRRKLKSPPTTLLFKRVLANGVPAQVRTAISGLGASSPPQLCTTGGGRWEVWLIDASGKSQGVVGAFWPDCSGSSGPVGSKPPKGASGPIDQCLIGTWEATSITFFNGGERGAAGGAGFRVTFASDNTETIDYSAMRVIVLRDNTAAVPDTITYRGRASGHISTQTKVAKIESVDVAGATDNIASAGRTFNVKLPGLGPGGLGTTANNNGYTCTQNSLEYQTSVAVDRHPTYSVKLTRRK